MSLQTFVYIGWKERDQQDATNLMFIIKLSQHASGNIMPIIRRTIVWTAAYGVLHWWWRLWLCGAGMQAVCTVKVTVLLMMGIMMPETCWDSLIINITLVAFFWSLSLHPKFVMHGHKSLKFFYIYINIHSCLVPVTRHVPAVLVVWSEWEVERDLPHRPLGCG